MKNAIILHGAPDKDEYYDPKAPSMSNAHWIPWLQGALLKKDIAAVTPEVPFSFERNWNVWKREVERYEITPETILVGHSTGAGFFVKYLSINKNISVDKVVFVAPYLDPKNKRNHDFFHDYEIDTDLVKKTKRITVFYSDNDEQDIQESITMLKNSIKNISFRQFHNLGHFTFRDMKTGEFPELLQEVL